MASMDFIYDLRDYLTKTKRDSIILSLQFGKHQKLKSDLICTIKNSDSLCALVELLPDIITNLAPNKTCKLPDKELNKITRGLIKQKNFFLNLSVKVNSKSCSVDFFYYLPKKDLVIATNVILTDFLKVLLEETKKRVEGGEEA